jgi:hypothetical protein
LLEDLLELAGHANHEDLVDFFEVDDALADDVDEPDGLPHQPSAALRVGWPRKHRHNARTIAPPRAFIEGLSSWDR